MTTGEEYYLKEEIRHQKRQLEDLQKELKNSTRIKEGELSGLSTLWYENGQKKSEGTFKDGKENGLTIYWDTHGNIIMQRTYKDGVEVK